jgi:predicted nucleic acid-binding protein
MLRWRIVLEDGRRSGHTYSQPDLIIAATALEHGLTVVTRDQSDCDGARAMVVGFPGFGVKDQGSGFICG